MEGERRQQRAGVGARERRRLKREGAKKVNGLERKLRAATEELRAVQEELVEADEEREEFAAKVKAAEEAIGLEEKAEMEVWRLEVDRMEAEAAAALEVQKGMVMKEEDWRAVAELAADRWEEVEALRRSGGG